MADPTGQISCGSRYYVGGLLRWTATILNAGTFTFAAPVVATLFFEHDNGEGIPLTLQ